MGCFFLFSFPFKASKNLCKCEDFTSDGMPNIGLLVLALTDGCPITSIQDRPILENVADGYGSGSFDHKGMLGHPPIFRSGK